MKYLKFFESVYMDRIRDLVTESMIELIDKGFTINTLAFYIIISNVKPFKWEEVEDSIIKFMIISNSYQIDINVCGLFITIGIDDVVNGQVNIIINKEMRKLYDIDYDSCNIYITNIKITHQ